MSRELVMPIVQPCPLCGGSHGFVPEVGRRRKGQQEPSSLGGHPIGSGGYTSGGRRLARGDSAP